MCELQLLDVDQNQTNKTTLRNTQWSDTAPAKAETNFFKRLKFTTSILRLILDRKVLFLHKALGKSLHFIRTVVQTNFDGLGSFLHHSISYSNENKHERSILKSVKHPS